MARCGMGEKEMGCSALPREWAALVLVTNCTPQRLGQDTLDLPTTAHRHPPLTIRCQQLYNSLEVLNTITTLRVLQQQPHSSTTTGLRK